MGQQKSILSGLACSIALTLAASTAGASSRSAVGSDSAYADLAELASTATLIDAWRDYALASLRPDFSWASESDQPVRAPSIFERGRARLLPPASHFNGSVIESTPLHVAITSTRVSDTPVYAPASGGLLPSQSASLQRYVVAPSISQKLGNFGSVSVSAILAYQHFAGISAIQPAFVDPLSPAVSPLALRSSDTSSGTGLRIDYTGTLSQTVNWEFGVQSRINMDPMDSYRGLYAEPGTFDIPGSANFGVVWSPTRSLSLVAGVEHVMYSQVTPFTSKALPAPLLADLASARSPEFAWQDLDVYSLVASWHGAGFGDWSFRYSTREQPVPTSALLRSALPSPAAHNYELGFSRAFGDRSTFRLSASYAPTDFVLGLPLSYTVSRGGNTMQWEALWITGF